MRIEKRLLFVVLCFYISIFQSIQSQAFGVEDIGILNLAENMVVGESTGENENSGHIEEGMEPEDLDGDQEPTPSGSGSEDATSEDATSEDATSEDATCDINDIDATAESLSNQALTGGIWIADDRYTAPKYLEFLEDGRATYISLYGNSFEESYDAAYQIIDGQLNGFFPINLVVEYPSITDESETIIQIEENPDGTSRVLRLALLGIPEDGIACEITDENVRRFRFRPYSTN